MAIMKDIPKKVSSSTQPAILSRKSYENKIRNSGNEFIICEEIHIDDEQSKSSYVKYSATDIVSMYETGSLFLSYQNTYCWDFDSSFTPKSDTVYGFIENLTYSSHQSPSKNDTCSQKRRPHFVYAILLKRSRYKSIPRVVTKERNTNHSNSEEIVIKGPILSKFHKLLSTFLLDIGNNLPSRVIQSVEKEKTYFRKQLLSPLNASPLSPFLNTRKILGCETSTSIEDMIKLDILEIYTCNKASMIDLYASIPSSQSFVDRKLQLVSSNHHNYAEDSSYCGYIQRDSLSYPTQSLLSNRSLKDEKSFSQNSFKVSDAFHNSFVENFFAGRSVVDLLHFGTLSIPQIAEKSLGITKNDSYVKFPIQDNKANHLGIRESKYERYKAHDFRFELSSKSNKCLNSHRTSYTTIDQIEMELNSKRSETSPRMICCESLRTLSSCENVSYATSTPDIISKKIQNSQINSKLKANKKYGYLNLFKSLEAKNAFRDAESSNIFSRIPSSQLASKRKIRTTEISSSKTKTSKNPHLLISLESHKRYGLKIDHSNTTPLGSVSLNQPKSFESSDINSLDKSALKSLSENQDCRVQEYDNFAHNKGSYALDKIKSSSVYVCNLTCMLCLSSTNILRIRCHTNSQSLAPKLNSSTKQMKLKMSRPQLMKSLPPIPALGYATIEKTPSSKDKFSDLELSLHVSPWLNGSGTNSLNTGSGESPGLKFSLPSRTLVHTDLEADKKTAQKIKPYNHDNSNNNQLKRPTPKLRLNAKKLKSFPSWPSISGNLDPIPQDVYSAAAALPNKNLDLERSEILKSTGLRLKYSLSQSHCSGTVRIKRAPNSVASTTNFPHSNPSDLFTNHNYSNDFFGEIISDLQSRRPSLDSDNLIPSSPVSNIKTNGKKRSKKKELFSGSPKGCLKLLESSNIVGSKLVISDDGSQIENHGEVRKKFENLRYRSKDEIRYRSPNTLEFRSIKIPKSTPNLHRNYFESIPCLRKEPRGQNLKIKIRDWIKTAKSAISNSIESQAQIWRKKKEVL